MNNLIVGIKKDETSGVSIKSFIVLKAKMHNIVI